MKIGYSCWGFLGNGVLDTPNGGRSHRFVLLRELIKQGADIVMLQKNRDLIEANQSFSRKYLTFDSDFPEINALFLEYRWAIPGRNFNVDKNSPVYTPDFDRQNNLIEFYHNKNIPILVWDKDQKLELEEGKDIRNAIVFEPALKPRFNRRRLLFPIDETRKKKAQKELKKYSKNKRPFKLIYIGNQYERDESFQEFIDKPAAELSEKAMVFGNWNKYPEIYEKNLVKFPNVDFKGRIEFKKTYNIYKKSFTTALIAPDRYYETGHFTQRLFEAMFGLCIPLTPNKYAKINEVIFKDFIVNSGDETAEKIKEFQCKSDTALIKLLNLQFALLDIFNVDLQAKVILKSINEFYE
jgi:hypothetical protein